MVRNQRRVRRRVVVDGVVIRVARATRQRRAKLPEAVVRDGSIVHDGRKPLRFHGRHVRALRAVLLGDDGFAGRFSENAVLHQPLVAPGVVVPPLVWVHVEGAVVERLDAQVLGEVDAFGAAVGVGAVPAGAQPALVAERDHVGLVERFDVG